ncbi:hypothetical protein ACFQ05_24860 [Amycolatopsis umgeniensis]|uniref:Uncharacterized protein n=1 Tax=Amycolatopsis umgeniensis TaxID=336628 RepID=A0A841BBS2_9PSEU|nr:hypothetical protein [Amycolatopsis umgeniensis]MBB5856108.1 hypothetical protein [Amycolatopsis umgeniensis]
MDHRLLDRIRDLHGSLGTDLSCITRMVEDDTPRADLLRDLGERLCELGAALLRRSDDVNADVLAKLPDDGWLPEAGARHRALVVAHNVGARPLRCGRIYLALCGAPCFPFYGRDPAGRTARHERCRDCQDRLFR